jgi:hypothetical protein
LLTGRDGCGPDLPTPERTHARRDHPEQQRERQANKHEDRQQNELDGHGKSPPE